MRFTDGLHPGRGPISFSPWGEGAPRGRMRGWSAHHVLASFPQPAVPATWAPAGDQWEKV